MRSARLHGPRDIRTHETEDPAEVDGETLIRVEAVGICGSDLHWFDEGRIGARQITDPVIPCHEIGGTALSGPYTGQVVALDPAIPCGVCEVCHAGKHNLCPNTRFAGDGTAQGGLAELLSWPDHLVFPMPSGSTPADAALLEPLGVAVYAVELIPVPIGQPVAVVGLGPIGVLLCGVARAAGASRVIGVDPQPHRREAALAHGADTVLTAEEALDPGVWETMAPGGCPAVYEVCGSEAALTEALTACAPDGDVAMLGIPDGNRSAFPADLARRKGLRLTTVRRMRDSYPASLRLVESGRLELDGVVTHTFGLDRAAEAFETAGARAGLKVVIAPQQ